MGVNILSQDVLALCLILSKGDTNMDLERIVVEAERFMEDNERGFGVTRADFRGLFWMGLLFRELGITRWDANLEGFHLKEIILDILRFDKAFFNDEGEYWLSICRDREPTADDYKKCHLDWNEWYTEEEFSRKIELKQQMRSFFNDPRNHQAELVARFMKENGIEEDMLFHYSHPGI